MAAEKKLQGLSRQILHVFPRNNPLPCIYLTAHQCVECYRLRDDFCGKKWWSIQDEVINANYDKLTLFTPPAYHYYLPAYLLNASKFFAGDNLVVEWTVLSLAPRAEKPTGRFFRERRTFFSETQRAIVREFLKVVLEDSQMSDMHEIADRALNQFWQEE